MKSELIKVANEALSQLESTPISTKGKLTESDKARLIKIVDQEFNSQTNVLQTELNEKRAKIQEDYKEESGFNKLYKEHSSLQKKSGEICDKMRRLVEEIQDKTGLTIQGEQQWGNKIQTLADRLRKAEESQRMGHNTKSKLITRITLAENKEEALLVMRAVLGNHII